MGPAFIELHQAPFTVTAKDVSPRSHAFRIWTLQASGKPHTMITIGDPVAGVHYMLDPAQKWRIK